MHRLLSDWAFKVLDGGDVQLEGVAYQSAMLDFGPLSVDGWLTRLAANELGVEEEEDWIDQDAQEVMLDGTRVKLTKLESTSSSICTAVRVEQRREPRCR